MSTTLPPWRPLLRAAQASTLMARHGCAHSFSDVGAEATSWTCSAINAAARSRNFATKLELNSAGCCRKPASSFAFVDPSRSSPPVRPQNHANAAGTLYVQAVEPCGDGPLLERRINPRPFGLRLWTTTQRSQITLSCSGCRCCASSNWISDPIPTNVAFGALNRTGQKNGSIPDHHHRSTRPTEGCPGSLGTVTTESRCALR